VLDDVAAFLVVAPLAGSLVTAVAVALWLLRGRGAGTEAAVRTSRPRRR
jgi:hypothetical protein